MHLTPQQEETLREIYSAIDGKEELRLHESNPRMLGAQDSQDIADMARIGATVERLFAYARRPKHEVLAYMLERHPHHLARMLEATRKEKEERSSSP